MEDNKEKDKKQEKDDKEKEDKHPKDKVTLESLTSKILEKDKQIEDLQKAYNLLYEKGNFNKEDKKEESKEHKKVSYDDIKNMF